MCFTINGSDPDKRRLLDVDDEKGNHIRMIVISTQQQQQQHQHTHFAQWASLFFFYAFMPFDCHQHKSAYRVFD